MARWWVCTVLTETKTVQRGAAQAQRAADEYIPSVAGSSLADDISKAKALLDSATIAPEEDERLEGAALRV